MLHIFSEPRPKKAFLQHFYSIFSKSALQKILSLMVSVSYCHWLYKTIEKPRVMSFLTQILCQTAVRSGREEWEERKEGRSGRKEWEEWEEWKEWEGGEGWEGWEMRGNVDFYNDIAFLALTRSAFLKNNDFLKIWKWSHNKFHVARQTRDALSKKCHLEEFPSPFAPSSSSLLPSSSKSRMKWKGNLALLFAVHERFFNVHDLFLGISWWIL